MVSGDQRDPQEIENRLREQASEDLIRLSIHGHQEMVEDEISYDALRETLIDCKVLENYPDHRRGACCLVCGRTRGGRYLHVVCTSALDVIVIITAYEPKQPKWLTPFQRGGKHEM